MTWQKAEVADPIFHKARRGESRTIRIDSTYYAVRRFITPTAAWVEELPPLTQWVLHKEPQDLPFVEALRCR